MQINLRQIEVFRAIMATGSISAAAQVLYVSQPAVSRLLGYLESRLGFALFTRVKGRLYATPEARQLLREVEAVHLGVQRVNKLAQTLSEQNQGYLHIASSPSLGQALVPATIAAFVKRHPNVRIRFEFLQHEVLKEQLLQRRVDIGLTLLPMEHPNLEVVPLVGGRMVCLCPRQHPLAAKAELCIGDLQPYGLIGYPPDTPLGQCMQRMAEKAGESIVPVIEVCSPQNALALTAAGAGISVVDEFTAHSLPKDHLVTRPIRGTPVLMAHLAHPCYEPLSNLGRAFVAELHQVLKRKGLTETSASPERIET
ncbi:MAG: LysR substrate-binding domain-containing protein [Burkholderiaceae bacterium]